MRIDHLEAQYEIPGFEIAPRAFEPEEAEEDFADAPFAQDVLVSTVPSPVGWQELLGLTTVPPSPISIDPPTRKISSGSRPGITTAYRLPENGNSSVVRARSASVSVRRMVAVMTQTRHAIARIRARAQEGV